VVPSTSAFGAGAAIRPIPPAFTGQVRNGLRLGKYRRRIEFVARPLPPGRGSFRSRHRSSLGIDIPRVL
jgi:hypothetical protein